MAELESSWQSAGWMDELPGSAEPALPPPPPPPAAPAPMRAPARDTAPARRDSLLRGVDTSRARPDTAHAKPDSATPH